MKKNSLYKIGDLVRHRASGTRGVIIGLRYFLGMAPVTYKVSTDFGKDFLSEEESIELLETTDVKLMGSYKIEKK